MHGKFFWYDIMTTDTKASEKFYADVIGWGAQESGVPGQQYTLLTVNGTPVAGLMTIPEDPRKVGVPPSWMGYIAVDDVDRAAARLQQEGGKVHRPPTDVPGVIRFCVVADPQGAGFIIAKGLGDARPEVPVGTQGTVGGASFMRWNGKLPLSFMQKCSAGPRPRQSTWVRWERISYSRPATTLSAA